MFFVQMEAGLMKIVWWSWTYDS